MKGKEKVVPKAEGEDIEVTGCGSDNGDGLHEPGGQLLDGGGQSSLGKTSE